MSLRPVWAEVDLGAIAHNVAVLRGVAAPAQVCAVVKAAAYGHGAVEVAHAAVEAGAGWLAVALVEEGMELRAAGIDAPILLLSEPPLDAFGEAAAHRLTPTVYTAEGVDAAAKAAAATGAAPLAVHVKVDTGMHRVGVQPERALPIAEAVVSHPELRLQGLYTHFAVADEPERDDFTGAQLNRLQQVVDRLAEEGIRPELTHASNSAGALAHAEARLDLVRCGIALYGQAPSPALAPLAAELRPALSLRARVSFVKEVDAGEAISYGLRYAPAVRTTIATVPIGYADGVPRLLSARGGPVLIGGRRCPIAGTVTMDQITVDCGPAADVHQGDEVVLIGRQGDEEIGAWEWAERTGTIAYEILCAIGPRVPRRYLRPTP